MCCIANNNMIPAMLVLLQAQDAMDAAEADIPAYPLEPIRSKRLKEVESGPERVVKVPNCCPCPCAAVPRPERTKHAWLTPCLDQALPA